MGRVVLRLVGWLTVKLFRPMAGGRPHQQAGAATALTFRPLQLTVSAAEPPTLVEPQLKWRRIIVVAGWCGTEPGGFVGSSASLARCSVLPALGGDVCRVVLGAGASPFGHHCVAITAV